MSFFKRVFKIGEANAHDLLDKMEDPIKMTEQGIRDLKTDLQEAMKALAEVKAISIRTRKESDSNKKLAADFERKAMLLLKKAQDNSLDLADAERLATEALSKKAQHSETAVKLSGEAEKHEKMVNNLQSNVNKIKSTISTYENDLTTLKARAKTAHSTKKINAQLAKIDSSGTISMLEKMKAKVEEDESLAEAYGEMNTEKTIDDEINSALGSGTDLEASSQLADLKKKMGIAA
ncbi:MAG: PspA/IM30 family protein [Desulfobacterales bacterium]|nr:PspA/IM30 family protein [Desulfobacterales bacterium]MCP4161332.1 PspA/IM30 family protein [Deltaproteobacteria bacterium]